MSVGYVIFNGYFCRLSSFYSCYNVCKLRINQLTE